MRKEKLLILVVAIQPSLHSCVSSRLLFRTDKITKVKCMPYAVKLNTTCSAKYRSLLVSLITSINHAVEMHLSLYGGCDLVRVGVTYGADLGESCCLFLLIKSAFVCYAFKCCALPRVNGSRALHMNWR